MLIQTLRDIQKRERLNDQEFAQKLGIHRVSWSRIKAGKASFGKKFLVGARQAYPELKGTIDIFLSGDATKENLVATEGIPSEPHQTTPERNLRAFGSRVRSFILGIFAPDRTKP